MKKLLAGIVGGALIALAAIVPAMADPLIVRVSGDTAAGENQPGWMFNRDLTTQTPFEFTVDDASIGAGSVYVLPIGGANRLDKFIAELFMLSPLADVESISFDFKLGAVSDPSDHVHFYANVYANFGTSAPDKFYDCRYNIIAASGSTTDFTAVVFDPDATYSVTQSGTSPSACPASPAAMGAGAIIRAFAINVGDTAVSLSDEGVNGYIDNVVVAQTTGTVIYDLDPEPPQPQTANDCKNGGWADYGFSNQGRCIQFVNTGKDSR